MYLKEESQRNFNPKVYLALYPDLTKVYSIKTVWKHYKQYGKRDNRIFTNKSLIMLFDGYAYCNMYPDVKQHYNKETAWIHYLIYGIKEARQCYIKGRKDACYMNYIINTVIKEEQTISYPNNEEKKITLLIRTCYRPYLFKRCITSILSQKYSNIHIIICYDNKVATNYITPYLNETIKAFYISEKSEKKYKFNLYCNTLINEVDSGYCMYLDDDNEFTHNNCLNIINHHMTNDKICVWKYLRGDKIVYPSALTTIKLGEIDSSSFCIPHTYKNHGKWPDKQCGDYYFLNSIIETLTSINNSTTSDEITYIPHILTKCIQNKIGNFGNPIINTV